jgi:hypothetical protein
VPVRALGPFQQLTDHIAQALAELAMILWSQPVTQYDPRSHIPHTHADGAFR